MAGVVVAGVGVCFVAGEPCAGFGAGAAELAGSALVADTEGGAV